MQFVRGYWPVVKGALHNKVWETKEVGVGTAAEIAAAISAALRDEHIGLTMGSYRSQEGKQERRRERFDLKRPADVLVLDLDKCNFAAQPGQAFNADLARAVRREIADRCRALADLEEVECVFAWTGSAGAQTGDKEGSLSIKARVFVPLEEPLQLQRIQKILAKGGAKAAGLDLSIYQPERLIYLSRGEKAAELPPGSEPVCLLEGRRGKLRLSGEVEGPDGLAAAAGIDVWGDESGRRPDLMVTTLKSRGLVLKDGAQGEEGRWSVRCPWAEKHTGGDLTGTVYMEPGWQGVLKPVFKCQHDSCRNKGLEDALVAWGLSEAAVLSGRVAGEMVAERFAPEIEVDVDIPDPNQPDSSSSDPVPLLPLSSSAAPRSRRCGVLPTEWPDPPFGKAKPRVTLDNVRHLVNRMFERGGHLRWNEMSRSVEVVAPWDPSCSAGSIYAETAFRAHASSEFLRHDMSGGLHLFHEHLSTVAQEMRYHPFEAWLGVDGRRPAVGVQWDGVDRWGKFFDLFVCSGEDAEALERLSGAVKIWCRQVPNVIGRRFSVREADLGVADLILVLQGPTGWGKTQFFRHLLPNGMTKVGVELGVLDKDARDLATRHVIGELGELDGIVKKADVDRLKSFCSSTIDEYRAAYARTAVRWPRLTVFGGSVNGSEFLRDETGNRRFLVLSVEEMKWKDLLRSDSALRGESDREGGEDWRSPASPEQDWRRQFWLQVWHEVWVQRERTWLEEEDLFGVLVQAERFRSKSWIEEELEELAETLPEVWQRWLSRRKKWKSRGTRGTPPHPPKGAEMWTAQAMWNRVLFLGERKMTAPEFVDLKKGMETIFGEPLRKRSGEKFWYLPGVTRNAKGFSFTDESFLKSKGSDV